MDNLLQQQLKEAGYSGEFDLASLIEACGDKFWRLWLRENGEWLCEGSDNFMDLKAMTPVEAVARLWLALNKKV